MGENGALWGGECLRVSYLEYAHLGGLPAVALPGGDLAARQPWRNLLAHCLAFVPDWQQYPETHAVQRQNWPAEPCARAWAFHDALAKGLAELAARHARRLSLSTICLSGGVLHNRLLRARLRHYLSDFTLLFPSRLPAGDGAISFGQAVVAAARSCLQRN